MLSVIVERMGPVQYILGLLFLLNIRAFPLAWHGEYYNLYSTGIADNQHSTRPLALFCLSHPILASRTQSYL